MHLYFRALLPITFNTLFDMLESTRGYNAFAIATVQEFKQTF